MRETVFEHAMQSIWNLYGGGNQRCDTCSRCPNDECSWPSKRDREYLLAWLLAVRAASKDVIDYMECGYPGIKYEVPLRILVGLMDDDVSKHPELYG